MNLLLFLIAELCTLAAGFGVSSWLRPARPVSSMERAGLSLMLGAAAISFLLFLLSWPLRGIPLIAVLSLLSMTLGGIGVWRWRRVESLATPGRWIFLALLAPALAFVAWQASNHPLYSDGLFNFEVRAHLAALYGGRIPESFFSDPTRAWMNPTYPLFLPMNQAWVYLWLGGPNQGVGQMLVLHFLAGAALLLYSGVTRLTGEAWRGGLAVAILMLVPNLMIGRGGALTLWADFPLASLFLASLLYLVEFETTGDALPLAAAFLALLPWVKREGVVLGGIYVPALCWIAWRHGKLRRIPLAVLPFVIVLAGWKLFAFSVQASATKDFYPLSLDLALKNSSRLIFSVQVLFLELRLTQNWSLLWIIAALAIVRVFMDRALARWRILVPMLAALLAIYASIYVFSTWAELPLHMFTSLPRLLIPVSVIALLLVTAAAPPLPRSEGAPQRKGFSAKKKRPLS